jgi:hypothetical protein
MDRQKDGKLHHRERKTCNTPLAEFSAGLPFVFAPAATSGAGEDNKLEISDNF